MNLFKKKHHSTSMEQEQLHTLNENFQSLEKLKKSSLLIYDAKLRRLYIEESLAKLMMVTSESWHNFMHNVFNWLFYKESSKAYNDYFLQEELAAVRKAKKQYAMLTRADIQRIKDARRAEIQQSDMPQIKPKPFEFFVLRHEISDNKQEVPGAEILVVGDYDGENDDLSMAEWKDVQRFINKEE